MQLARDVKTALRIGRGMLRSRRNRRTLSEQLATLPEPSTGYEIVVYFADAKVNLYQLRQWYAPLVELSKTHPVIIVSRAPGAMLQLLEESPLPVVYLRKIVDFENFLAARRVKLMFYVNQNAKNFQAMRYGRMWHVFINHGESDKAYMSSAQYKAYDYAFIAGDQASDRLRRALWDYDVDTRALQIGRPQADHFSGELPYEKDDRTVVLYAPTWEGDRESMAYGSVMSHGVTLTQKLLADPRFRLIYRPHPRSGIQKKAYGAANRSIIEAIAAANQADPTAQHVYDDGPDIGWQLADADVAITDISAMIYDRLAVGKPLLVTRPASPLAVVETDGYLGDAEWLTTDAAVDIVGAVDRALADPEALEKLGHWVRRYFGDTTPGAATSRFHGAVEKLIGVWNEHAALHTGPDWSPELPAPGTAPVQVVGSGAAAEELPDEDDAPEED